MGVKLVGGNGLWGFGGRGVLVWAGGVRREEGKGRESLREGVRKGGRGLCTLGRRRGEGGEGASSGLFGGVRIFGMEVC